METGFRTPLLDFFRRGEVARDVRMLAAQGAIAPRPLEQLALLMLLTADADSEIRVTAETTLQRIPHELLTGFLARSEVPGELRDFFRARGIAAAALPGSEPVELLPDDEDSNVGEATGLQSGEGDETRDTEKLSLVQRIAAMSTPQRMKAAMKGSREMRAIFIRDPNKLVSLSVLSSPKVTETEIESFARMGSVGEDVLRTIGQTRAWVKSYGVAHALVKNAKTPLAMSLTLLNRLNEGDVRRLSIDRNVPEPLRIAARKKLVMG